MPDGYERSLFLMIMPLCDRKNIMNESPKPEPSQSIFDHAHIEGDLTVDKIEQTININSSEQYKPTEIPQNIPNSNTIKFVGRTETLQELHQQLQNNNQLAITAVKGMGGIGKTELAIQYSLRKESINTYQGEICWLKARQENIGLQIVRFAQTHLDLKPPED